MNSLDDYSQTSLLVRQLVTKQLSEELFLLALSQLVATLDRNPWLWELGDGDGGWVKQVIKGQMQSIGRHWDPEKQDPPKPNIKRQAVLDRDGHCCINCFETENLHIDHIFPKSRGGSDKLENLQVLCSKCNISKHAMTMEEWKASGKADAMKFRS